MTTTLYIDANRTLSSKKEKNGNNNEWTLPPQTEIALQDTFINRKGITGQTIEIDEDIEEELYYTYYLSDNPQFVPSTVFQGGINSTIRGARTLDRTFCPLGSMFQQNVDDNAPSANGTDFMVDRGQVILYGENVPNQRLGMFRLIRDTADVGKTNFNFQSMSGFLDPFYSGYTEKPMFACVCSNRDAFLDHGLSNIDLTQQDKFLKPLIGHTTIFVPKGVYSVNELADLIEGQMNGSM